MSDKELIFKILTELIKLNCKKKKNKKQKNRQSLNPKQSFARKSNWPSYNGSLYSRGVIELSFEVRKALGSMPSSLIHKDLMSLFPYLYNQNHVYQQQEQQQQQKSI